MQTRFSPAQLDHPLVREADGILRKCVHCGFCTATCPTYVVRGDELDSPRGRISLIKDFLERDGPPSPAVVKHTDRCLTCLSCMTTCPSGVDYRHLADAARERIEAHEEARSRGERWLRWSLSRVLSSHRLFRWAVVAGRLARPVRGLLPDRLANLTTLTPAHLPPPSAMARRRVFPSATGAATARVVLLTGCVQSVLAPDINDAAIRLLTRHGVEVVVSAAAECCGGLAYHLGKIDYAKRKAAAAIEAWWSETAAGGGPGIDAIVMTTSGCGLVIRDYGHLFLHGTEDMARKARTIADLAVDVSEFMARIGLSPPTVAGGQRVAYHAACSLQHGQQVRNAPKDLLRRAGFAVQDVPEGHLCCGSAGTYNLLQPQLAEQLKIRKVANIQSIRPDVIAAGNLGCILHIGSGTNIPIVHTVQLLDWATGGPRPNSSSPAPGGRG